MQNAVLISVIIQLVSVSMILVSISIINIVLFLIMSLKNVFLVFLLTIRVVKERIVVLRKIIGILLPKHVHQLHKLLIVFNWISQI